MSQMPVLSVSELNAYVKGVLDRDALLQDLRLRGEISNFKRHSLPDVDLCICQSNCIRHFLKDKRYNLLEARKVIAAPLYIEHEVSSGQCLRELSCHPCSGCIQFLRYCDGLACIDFTALCIQNGVTVLGNSSVHIAVIPLQEVKSI